MRGRHAIVTGASRGIGAVIAQALLAQGAKVTCLARDEAALKTLWDGRDNVRFGVCDVTDEARVGRSFADAADAFGPATILVNNAGSEHSGPFHRTSPDNFRRMLEVNLLSTVHGCHAAVPSMREAGWGRIVNIASTAGLKGGSYISAYSTAKHAVVGLTRSLAVELARTGITVNAVCPGFTDTDMVGRTIANIGSKTGRSSDEALAELTRTNPLGRLVTPAEVAASVVWLCSDEAASITGQAIAIDGGETQ